METRLWLTVDHLDPPDLPRHGCNSNRGPAANGGQTVLANDRNGGRLRLNASCHDDDGPLVRYRADAVSSEESMMLPAFCDKRCFILFTGFVILLMHSIICTVISCLEI